MCATLLSLLYLYLPCLTIFVPLLFTGHTPPAISGGQTNKPFLLFWSPQSQQHPFSAKRGRLFLVSYSSQLNHPASLLSLFFFSFLPSHHRLLTSPFAVSTVAHAARLLSSSVHLPTYNIGCLGFPLLRQALSAHSLLLPILFSGGFSWVTIPWSEITHFVSTVHIQACSASSSSSCHCSGIYIHGSLGLDLSPSSVVERFLSKPSGPSSSSTKSENSRRRYAQRRAILLAAIVFYGPFVTIVPSPGLACVLPLAGRHPPSRTGPNTVQR